VGGLDFTPRERVAWSPQNSLTKQVLLPLEVGADWAPIVNQAVTHTACSALVHRDSPRQSSGSNSSTPNSASRCFIAAV
jgi:hypothetical protein